MNLLVLPASGQNFISQLSILQYLCDIEYSPTLILGSSGGNLAAYIVTAADWKSNHIERLIKELKSTYFSRPWHNISIVSEMIGFFNGNAFQSGIGMEEYMNNYFSNKSITKYEIWTGTYNRDLQKFRLFCNISESDSIIDCNHIDYNLTQSIKPYFCNGNIDKIAAAGLASASIPGLVPPVLIDNNNYTDGAICGASPLSIIHGAILKYIKNNNKSLHITYVNSKDLSQANNIPNHNLFDTWKQAVNNLIKSQTLIDRLVAHDLLFNGKTVRNKSFECNFTNLIKNKNKRNKLQFSLLEIFPTEECDIDINNFNSDDLIKNLKYISTKCQCHFWWINN